MSINERRFVSIFFWINDWHKQRRFHINRAVQPEDIHESIDDQSVESSMLGKLCFEVIQKYTERFGGLAE